jgi:DNA-binding Lrp family transcriptional regulator
MIAPEFIQVLDIIRICGLRKPLHGGHVRLAHHFEMLRDCEIILRILSLPHTFRSQLQELAMAGHKLDPIDRQILAELQADGRMTNVELAKRVGISAPPCLRRVRTLEEAGYIRGYHADIDARELGFEVQVFAMVRLQSQAERDLSAFEAHCRALPLVRECHMLNGEIDFILKCVAPDLSTFQTFLTEQLTSAANVASVKTSLVIRCAKDEPGLSFEVLEARLAKRA